MTLLLIVIVLLAIRTPLFVVIGTSAMLCFLMFVQGYASLDDLQVIPAKIVALTKKNVLLAIPFFVLSGSIMSAGGIARRLVRVAELMVGHMRGGLAIASVLACMIFAAISGSSPVTLIAVGSLMVPAMLKAGYRENFALGLVTTAGSLGCLIPPSIPMLVYAISVSGSAAVNVSDLFIAGFLPAVLIAGMLAVYSWFQGNVPARKRATRAEFLEALREGVWALLLPVIILGGIYSGVFTATEASAVSVVYAVVVELLIHRELTPQKLKDAVLKSISMMGALLLIIVLSFGLNDFLIEQGVAESLLTWIREQQLSPAMFLLAINIFLVVTGCLMDSLSAIVLFTPLIAPTAVALGIDPLHLGVVFIVNMEIGYVAPPIATNLFVSAQLFQRPFGQVVKAVVPTLAILCLGLVFVTYIPTVSVGPVYAMRGEGFYQPFASFQAKRKPEAEEPGSKEVAPAKTMSLTEMMRKVKEREAAADAGTDIKAALPATP